MSIDVKATALDVEGEIFTRASGIPAGITRAALAADTAFADTFEPIVTEIILSASPVVGSSGTVTNNTGVPVNTFADAANSFASWTTAIPASWTTFDIDVEYMSASGTGNVVLRADLAYLGAGDAPTVTAHSSATLACTTAIARSTVASGVTITANKLMSLRMIRLGSDGSDTLAAVFHIRAVRLVQAS